MNYNQMEAKQQAVYGQGMVAGAGALTPRSLTVAENIDNRIASLQDQIERLQVVKAKLSKGAILDVSLEDLGLAMGRY